MPHAWKLGLALGTVALAAGAATPAPAAAACANENTPVASATAAQSRGAILCLINEVRTKRNLPAMKADSRLEAAAQAHADDMQKRNYFDHNGPLGVGSTPASRVTGAGYTWSRVGENIAKGQGTPFEVMEGWMKSSGHCTNILGAFNDVGVGVTSGRYWVQDFGVQQGAATPASSTACPSSLGRSPSNETSPDPQPTPAPTGPTGAAPTLVKASGRKGRGGKPRLLRAVVSCPAGLLNCAGKVRVQMKAHSTVIGRRSFTIPAGTSQAVFVRLSAKGEARLKRTGRRKVHVEVNASGARTTSRNVTLPRTG